MADGKSTLRRRARRLMASPITDLVVLVLIALSVGMLLVEVVVQDALLRWAVGLAGNVLTGVFAVELCLRFWVARKKTRFFRQYWLDIAALLPVIRPLRMLRVLRLLRLFRAGHLVNRRLLPFQGIFSVAFTEMITLATVTIVLVLSAAMVLHMGEGGEFADFNSSVWYSVFSLVGGEPIGAEPHTEVGRWTTLVLMLGGLTVFGMFVGTVSAGMSARMSGRHGGLEVDLDELERHVVVCGWNGSAPTLIRELFAMGGPAERAVVVITEGEDKPADWPLDGVRTDLLYHHQGDWTRVEVLDEVNIREAHTTILLRDVMTPRSDQDRDARTVLAALTIEMMQPDIYTVAELHSAQSEQMLRMRGVEEVVVGELYAGMILGSASRNPGLVRMLEDILDMRSGNSFWSVTTLPQHDGWTVRQLRRELHDRFDATLMSVDSVGEDSIHVNPPDELVIGEGDVLMVVARKRVSW